MKKFVLAALAAMSLSMGVASAQQSNLLDNLGHARLPSPAYTYSAANG
jgi:hypothetical protein